MSVLCSPSDFLCNSRDPRCIIAFNKNLVGQMVTTFQPLVCQLILILSIPKVSRENMDKKMRSVELDHTKAVN